MSRQATMRMSGMRRSRAQDRRQEQIKRLKTADQTIAKAELLGRMLDNGRQTGTFDGRYFDKERTKLLKQIGVNTDQIHYYKYNSKVNMNGDRDDDITTHTFQYQLQAATAAQKFLNKIGDHDDIDIHNYQVKNMPEILKTRDYSRDNDGYMDVDWHDFNGKFKSIKRLKWDASFWDKRADAMNKASEKTKRLIAKSLKYEDQYLTIMSKDDYWPNKWEPDTKHSKSLFDKYNSEIDSKSLGRRSNSWSDRMMMSQYNLKYDQMLLNSQYDFMNRSPHNTSDYWAAVKNAKADKAAIADVTKDIKIIRKHLNHDHAMAKHYRQAAWNKRRRQILAHNNPIIAASVAANDKAGMTSIYRADHMDPTVIAVAELSPTESVSMNLPTKSVDKSTPEGDFANVSSVQLSGTYYAYIPDTMVEDHGYGEANSPSYTNRVQQYKTLKDWAVGNHRLVVRGYSFWTSTSIQSLSRTADSAAAANGLPMSITFQYQRVAEIKMAKQKKAPASKKKGRARKRSRKPKPKSHKIKSGDTMWGLCGGNAKKVAAMRKANPHVNPNNMHVGGKLVMPR